MRYVVVHGHFYQPPRESPWLELVERQDSARPFHDWNERVHAECYGPNAAARILDGERRIERIVNNYASISFNFGPTLLSWMEEAHPEVHEAIVAADRRARELRGGAGAALAQVHGHVILPLANERDRHTQVVWGIADFEHRFGRRPRGLWLPETAADVPSLEALAAHGIEFTILAPHQARRVRRPGGPWEEVRGRVDPRRPYAVGLPSGRRITVFFYDGPLSRAVAFERLLDDGAGFAGRLLSGFDRGTRPGAEPEAQVVHIATDGESYGHHHRFGEMALAYALRELERRGDVRVTTYEEILDRHPPTWEAEIEPETSWSCAHGIERWRSDCGCRVGSPPGWTQAWRAPLRAALDWLRDRLALVFEDEGRALLRDPWAARDGYIDVLLDRSPASVERFLGAHGTIAPGDPRTVRLLELCEMQRHAMLMYTSCGWFFDDLGGLEPGQILAYAGRALELGERSSAAAARDLEEGFLERLALARSNDPEIGDGRAIFEARIRPARVDLRKVAAHFSASSLFGEERARVKIGGFEVDVVEHAEERAGQARLGLGRLRVRSIVTGATEDLGYAALHLGDHNLSGGVRPWSGAEAHGGMGGELRRAFLRADLTEALRAIERHFPGQTYSLGTLFRDEQKRILDEVLASTLDSVEQSYRAIYAQFAPLMRYVAGLGQPVPRALHQAAEYTLTARLRAELERGRALDLALAESLVREARDAGVVLELEDLGAAARTTLEALLGGLGRAPDDLGALRLAGGLAALAGRAGLRFDAAVAQNRFYAMRETVWLERRSAPEHGAWAQEFRMLGLRLGVRVD